MRWDKRFRIRRAEKDLMRSGWEMFYENDHMIFFKAFRPFMVYVNEAGEFETMTNDTPRDYLYSCSSHCSIEFMENKTFEALERRLAPR